MDKITFRNLKADEVDARVGTCNEKGFSLLLYKDARVDMQLLDEVVGSSRWQRRHYEVKGNLFCSLGVYDPDRKEWIWKDDCGTESYTEKEKGEASDSFKRAAVNWGLGRELYTAPFIYIKGHTEKNSQGKYVPTYSNFTVKVLETTDGKITKLQIKGYSKDNGEEVIYEYGMKNGDNKVAPPKKAETPKTTETPKADAPKTTETPKPVYPKRPTAVSTKNMTLDEAWKFKTKNGKFFHELTDDYLQMIIDSKAKEETKQAARVILESRKPENLPFPVDDDLAPLNDDPELPWNQPPLPF